MVLFTTRTFALSWRLPFTAAAVIQWYVCVYCSVSDRSADQKVCLQFNIYLALTYVTAASMNNLNDPPRWNIQPDPRGRGAGAGDGNQWNYALLVPMLGLAAFRKLRKVLCLGVCVDEVTDTGEHSCVIENHVQGNFFLITLANKLGNVHTLKNNIHLHLYWWCTVSFSSRMTNERNVVVIIPSIWNNTRPRNIYHLMWLSMDEKYPIFHYL